MTNMAWKTRIIDLFNQEVALQETGNTQGIEIVLPDAQVNGFKTADDQPAIKS